MAIVHKVWYSCRQPVVDGLTQLLTRLNMEEVTGYISAKRPCIVRLASSVMDSIVADLARLSLYVKEGHLLSGWGGLLLPV